MYIHIHIYHEKPPRPSLRGDSATNGDERLSVLYIYIYICIYLYIYMYIYL